MGISSVILEWGGVVQYGDQQCNIRVERGGTVWDQQCNIRVGRSGAVWDQQCNIRVGRSGPVLGSAMQC